MKMNGEFWIPQYIDGEREPAQYHDEWRTYLNRKNSEEVSELMAMPFYSQRFGLYSRRIVKFFLRVSHLLVMPPEVTYLTVEMYDKFWLHYLCDVSGDIRSNWHSVEKSFEKQACLIALSCIQLASKLSCHSKVLPMSAIIEYMKSHGHEVDKKTILQSELLVLRTIDFVMPSVSLLSYVEMLIEDMTVLLSNVCRSELLQVCVKVINVTFIFHRDIYTKLHLAFQQRRPRSNREKNRFLSIEGDSIRLAASVVCAAAHLYDPSGRLSAAVADYLGETTKYQTNEIVVLSNIIIHVVLRNSVKH